jgi:hypothetical protein
MSHDLAIPFIGWPADGVVRVHYEPSALPHLGDEPGPNRFDDPRPRTIDRFLMRYAASSLRGCLLELLAGFRPTPEASERESAVETDDPDFVQPPDVAEWQYVADFLAGRKVASVASADLAVVSLNDPAVQHELDHEPAVRAVLDTEGAKAALLEPKGHRVHLDNAAIRLSSPIGRYITQACALALYDRQVRPDVIHYRSRHDDSEDCWAIFHHAQVQIGAAEELSPSVDAHAAALRSVAELWDLPIPPAWTD